MKPWIAMGALIALGMLQGLTGCAEVERANARNTGSLLVAAGFRQVPANTPERANELATMTPRRISMVKRGGKTWFLYPDPSYCNCLYMGDGEQYREYQRLAVQEKIADEKLEAAEAIRDASMEQTMWGPWWE